MYRGSIYLNQPDLWYHNHGWFNVLAGLAWGSEAMWENGGKILFFNKNLICLRVVYTICQQYSGDAGDHER